jgi:asparagine synthase (glutamine-hydrolysing)
MGYFKPEAVAQLVQKMRQVGSVSETDDMALAGILSTQLLHYQFIEKFKLASTLSEIDRVKVCRRN